MQIIKGARGRITGHFGDTNVPGANVKTHGGMDIGHGNMTADDLRVVAPASGRVTFAGFYGTYGLTLIINHGDGYESLLAHLDETNVDAGMDVSQLDDIAVMGDSGGDWPVHLHQELRRYGVQLDPEKYFVSTPAGGTGTPIAPHEGDEDMARIVTVGKHQHLVGATRSTKIDNPDDAVTLRKYLGGADTLTEAEHNTVKEYLWRLSPIHDGVPGADGWQSLGARVVDIEAGAGK